MTQLHTLLTCLAVFRGLLQEYQCIFLHNLSVLLCSSSHFVIIFACVVHKCCLSYFETQIVHKRQFRMMPSPSSMAEITAKLALPGS
jgi:hypothetical protein